MKSRRVLVLMHEDLVPPDSIEGLTDEQISPWKTEYDVTATLQNLGHEVEILGVSMDLGTIRDAIVGGKPDVAFNLLEEFHGVAQYDQHVVSYLELMKQCYTGCSPRGLMLARDKALCKKLLTYHRIAVPDFAVFARGRRMRRPRRLEFPLLVKSATEEASLGISQASVVTNDEKLTDRVDFIHNQLGTDALVEEYIDGRELYVGVLGNHRLRTLPVWELRFDDLPAGAPRIATAKVKWDTKYQARNNIITTQAVDLPTGVEEQLPRLSRRIYRLLGLSGYARMDFRLGADGRPYVLEANPNPNLAYGEDFAKSAEQSGISYPDLIQQILQLGLNYQAEWRKTGIGD